jgi:hypothetical protein
MKVCLVKCANKDKHPVGINDPEEFNGNHTDFGRTICNWCAGMWVHICDKDDCF